MMVEEYETNGDSRKCIEQVGSKSFFKKPSDLLQKQVIYSQKEWF